MPSTNRRPLLTTVLLVMVLTSGVTASVSIPVAAASQPHATFSFDPSSPSEGESVTFDGRSSYATNSSIASYAWEYETEDGSTGTASGEQVIFDWSESGDYTVRLTVTDNNGNTDTTERTVSVIPDQIQSSQNNPYVEGEEGAYRIIANNDASQNETGDHADLYSIPTAVLEQREAAEDLPLVRIDNRTLTLYQATQYGLLTDAYRENLYNPVRLPTDDSWMGYNDVTVTDTYFLGFTANETHAEWTNENRSIWVKVESEPGWRPVRNAKVLREDTGDEHSLGAFYIANNDTAEVYDGNAIDYVDFNRKVVEETFISTGHNVSQVVVSDGKPRYPLENATVEGEWQGENQVILDHYASTARITEGAIYDDFWLVNPDGINVTVLNDYRLETPPDYEDNETCSYTVGNVTESGTDTKWETWERVDYQSTTQLYHAGTYHEATIGEYIFHISNPKEGNLVPFSNVEVTLRHEWGVDSTCPGNDWSNSETVTVSNSYDATWHTIKPATAKDLNITVYIADKGYEQELYFDIVGNQRPEENPLDKIEFVAEGDRISKKTVTLRSPWTFIPQSLYNRIEHRQSGFDEWRYPSTRADASLHNLHRDYLDGNSYKISNQGNIRINAERRNQAQVFEGISVGPYVNDTHGDVPLYQTIGGQIAEIPGERELNNPKAYATDIFGNRWEVNVVKRSYIKTDIQIELKGGVIHGQLVDADGNGVAGKELTLSGANNSSVTTDQNGEFTVHVSPKAGRTSMKFEGDPLRSELDTYYEESTAAITTPTNMLNIVGTPIGYVSDMISNLMVFVEWLALGLFIVWWIKYREQAPRNG